MSGEAVAFCGVNYGYRQGFKLRDVEFTVTQGHFLCLGGPNGAGKTTLIRLLSRILKPDSGEIRLLGRPVSALSQRELACRLAAVPQETWAGFPFTVREMVAMGRIPRLGLFQLEGTGDREAVSVAMEETRVAHLAQRPFSSLSGGERQRVIIARALAQRAPVMILDEPTSQLDLGHRQQLLDLLARLNRERGITILLVTHDLGSSAQYADEVVLLQQGRVAAAGDPAEVLTAERVAQVFNCQVLVDAHPVTGGIRVTPIPGGDTGNTG